MERFIKFANDSNVGYLQISGGGEPFLELSAIERCLREVYAKRIILVTSGFWASNREKAHRILGELYQACKGNKSNPRVTIRVSISKDHSIKLKDRPLVNLIKEFEQYYAQDSMFTLQLKFFEGDNTLTNYLDLHFPRYSLRLLEENGTDDSEYIKIMPWKYLLTLSSGFKIIVGKSRVFYPTLRPDLNNSEQIDLNNTVFDMDSVLSQSEFPSIVYGGDGTKGLDWIVEYNGNVCTWQNRVQDNLLNIYEDDYEQTLLKTVSDLVTYSFIDKGSVYRNRIIEEISPKTVRLMKAVNIRDYAGTLLFADERIRLYYNVRVLQDYLDEGRIENELLDSIPFELKEAIVMGKEVLHDAYSSSSYSIVQQEFKKPICFDELSDFLELIKLDHFEVSKHDLQYAIRMYNEFPFNDSPCMIRTIDDVILQDNMNVHRRLTRRMMTRKHMKSEKSSIRVILCRHGETNWNVEGRIKGQKEDLYTYFTEKGTNQIAGLAEWLKKKAVDAVFTSDLYRAIETSKAINTVLNTLVYTYKNFRGLNMGNCQGMLMKD